MHAHSLIAPVKPYSDVALDLPGLVLGQVALDELSAQVDELVHHVAQLMEQVHLVFLSEQAKHRVRERRRLPTPDGSPVGVKRAALRKSKNSNSDVSQPLRGEPSVSAR